MTCRIGRSTRSHRRDCFQKYNTRWCVYITPDGVCINPRWCVYRYNVMWCVQKQSMVCTQICVVICVLEAQSLEISLAESHPGGRTIHRLYPRSKRTFTIALAHLVPRSLSQPTHNSLVSPPEEASLQSLLASPLMPQLKAAYRQRTCDVFVGARVASTRGSANDSTIMLGCSLILSRTHLASP